MATDAFALILTMLALGMGLARTSLLPANAAEVLNLVVLYVCLPAAVLLYVPHLRLDRTLLGLAVTPWILMGVTFVVISAAARAGWVRPEARVALLMCVGMCNSSFLGYPMIRALLGEDAVAWAVVYDQFGSFLLLSTVGLVLVARHGGEGPVATRDVVLRILRFPAVWALGFGLTLMPETPPGWIASGLRSLSDAMLPLVMLAVGLSIRLRLPREEVSALVLGLGLRLVVLPALAIPIAWAFRMPDPMLRVNVLESAMPSMVSAAALAIAQGLAPRLCAALVAWGIVLAMGTLPAWAWLLARL